MLQLQEGSENIYLHNYGKFDAISPSVVIEFFDEEIII